jgi:hypothetical protein
MVSEWSCLSRSRGIATVGFSIRALEASTVCVAARYDRRSRRRCHRRAGADKPGQRRVGRVSRTDAAFGADDMPMDVCESSLLRLAPPETVVDATTPLSLRPPGFPA